MPVVQRVISSKVCQLYAPSSPSRTRPFFPDSHMYSRALARLPCTLGSDSETALLVLGNCGDCSGGLGLFRPSRGVWVPVRFLELLVAFRGSFRIFPNPPRICLKGSQFFAGGLLGGHFGGSRLGVPTFRTWSFVVGFQEIPAFFSRNFNS